MQWRPETRDHNQYCAKKDVRDSFTLKDLGVHALPSSDQTVTKT